MKASKGLTRKQRIADAERKVTGLKLVIDPLRKQLDDAETELNRAKESYDKGERVNVTETCKRGCCIENDYNGVVVDTEKNDTYRVKGDDGHEYRYVYSGDMKRL